MIVSKADFTSLFEAAPRLNPSRSLVTGLICGVRIEEIEEPLMREICYFDKLIDELAAAKQSKSSCEPRRFALVFPRLRARFTRRER